MAARDGSIHGYVINDEGEVKAFLSVSAYETCDYEQPLTDVRQGWEADPGL